MKYVRANRRFRSIGYDYGASYGIMLHAGNCNNAKMCAKLWE